jgi:glycosyltransferase involved in cell wall biosynthesis
LLPSVHISLSTYNGMRFLSDQMDSIFAQSHPPVTITIRDDGSTDGTYQKLRQYETSYPNVRVIRGENLGAAASFLDLLARASSECDYFAFADQDDIWLPCKLENAVSQLAECDPAQPLMYCSRVEYVDEQLRHLGYKAIPRRIGFGNALVQNIAVGCTVVLNREAKKLIAQKSPSRLIMHDWWCYLVVSALGRVIYDERPSLKYRQHPRNAIGDATNIGQSLLRRVERLLNYKNSACTIIEQALEFRSCFGELLNDRDSSILERFLSIRGNIWSRIAYCSQVNVWRQSRIEDAILRTLILVGRM